MNTGKKIFYKVFNAVNYFDIRNELYKKVQEPPLIEKYSAPFVLFSGTCLEYLLNDLLIEHCNRYFHELNQKKYSESLISMNFNAKLTCVLPIISNSRFLINTESSQYKILCEMISHRNKIAHGKDFYIGTSTTDINEDSYSIVVDPKKLDNNPLELTLKQCQDYKEALDSFYNEVFIPYFTDSHATSDFVHIINKSSHKKAMIEIKPKTVAIKFGKKK